jgi:hypothetical protein
LSHDGEAEAIGAALVEAKARLATALKAEAVMEDQRQAREVRNS